MALKQTSKNNIKTQGSCRLSAKVLTNNMSVPHIAQINRTADAACLPKHDILLTFDANPIINTNIKMGSFDSQFNPLSNVMMNKRLHVNGARLPIRNIIQM